MPLAGRATGQPLLVRSILTVKNTLNGTHEWCEGGTKFLGSGPVLALLGGCSKVGNDFPEEGGLDVARCVGINDAVIEKRHPATPDQPHHSGCREHQMTLPVVFRNKDGFH